MEGSKKPHHFVLVHGICHGAWCWYKVIPLLRSGGHRVTALDLGACGIHPKKLDEIATASEYVQPLTDFLGRLPNDEKVVLVGHSYGGLAISMAMESFSNKVLVSVFLSAYMPNSNHAPATLIQEYFGRLKPEFLMDCQVTFDQGLENPPTSVTLGSSFLEAVIYTHCKPEDVELGKLLTRQGALYVEDMRKENLMTEDNYGSVKRVYVICQDDQLMDQDFQKYNIQNTSLQAHEVKSIPGAGHMVMLTKPQELCSCLLQISAAAI
ncbi:hypothetical protein DM860_005012 [Cuscuta australis]|uniref:AB hydrolase-1 domain-containing protein n=1 Tax=Cuscuta australis TaxID=267555 RepID=A0A328DRY2_9ASTE|nr:hypothetical protein DM860_005012 [Cuscuta australis]